MHPFRLDFAAPPQSPTVSLLAAAPDFRLDPPAAGWIICHVERADFLPIRLSDVFPPLADLWLWSQAVAQGLLPVRVRIDEEGADVLLAAENLPEGHLRLSLIRRMDASSFEPERVIDAIVWTEARHVFLARWGALWAAYCQDDGLPWSEWKRFENQALPEPMRDMPWDALADVPALEPLPWTREQRIAWFYLQMAYHLRSRGHGCEYLDDPGYWTLRELAFARLSIRAVQAAWKQLREDMPPSTEALRLIDDAQEQALDDLEASAQDTQKGRLSLDHAYLAAIQGTFDHITEIVEGCLPRLPIGQGSFIADERGRRAVIVCMRGREWLLYWDDGRITLEDAFHAARHPSWRWPVAHGPDFDPNALDPIDRRRLRFLELAPRV